MTTDGERMQVFGPSLGVDAVADARAAEAAGYSGVRVIDHLFCALPGRPAAATEHPFVALGAAAAATERVLLTQTVLDVTRRHPTEVAQAVATLDRISGGRAELGLGTGWYEPEHDAVGLPLGAPADRVGRLLEALAVCRSMLDHDGCVDHRGRWFEAHVDVPWAPTPHAVEILVGVARPVLMRRAAALADRIEVLTPLGVGPGDEPITTALLHDRLQEARAIAADHGRALRFSARVELELDAQPSGPLHLAGGSDRVLEGAHALAELGVDRLSVLPLDPASAEWLQSSVASLRQLSPSPLGS